jgi:hypothetical protein
MNKQNMSAIIALRCYPEWKQEMTGEAQKKGLTLSDFIYECIEEGYKIVKQKDAKTDNC